MDELVIIINARNTHNIYLIYLYNVKLFHNSPGASRLLFPSRQYGTANRERK